LLSDPPAIGRLVAAVVRAVSIPVTLKVRSGPDAEHFTAVDAAVRSEQAGAAAVSLHARSVAQGYVGGPDWQLVARLKQAVRIPVIGSGGIRTAADAVEYLRQSGADAVAVGRGCLGNPWIFSQARALHRGGAASQPTLAERGRVLLRLIAGEFHLYGAPLALRRLPRTSGYFARWLADPAAFRQGAVAARSLPQFRRLVKEHFSR
jgi:tRNA-dihydrouridine synthase